MAAKQDSIPPGEHKLNENTLGLFESSIMGVAGSAPAYSLAATTVILATSMGLYGPGELLYSGIAMFGVVFAFHYMGQHTQNAGATYVWVRNALHPVLGYLAGWSLVTASIIFGMVSTVPASQSFLQLFTSDDKIISNVHWTTLIGVILFLIMVGIIAYGIKFTAKAQVIMTVTEIGILWIFDILAVFHSNKAHAFSWDWFNFNSITSYVDGKADSHGLSAILVGAVAGAFFYWGWDVTSNLNEETKDGHKTAGMGGIIGVFFVFLTFLFTLVAVNLILTDAQLVDDGASILSTFAAALIPGWVGKFIIVSVMLSTVATIETQMIQVTRTLFSMGRDKAMPSGFGKVHHEWRTPLNATIFTTVFVLLFFIGSQFVSSVGKIATSGVNAIGIQICFYYALAALSVIVIYRHQIFLSVKNFVFMGLWPAMSAIFLFTVLLKVVPGLAKLDLYIGVGTVALGFIPIAIYWSKGSDYFKKVQPHERRAALLR